MKTTGYPVVFHICTREFVIQASLRDKCLMKAKKNHLNKRGMFLMRSIGVTPAPAARAEDPLGKV